MTLALGAMHAHSYRTDPKHFGFVAARYKFVAKMFRGLGRVLEVGCGDCTFAPIVRHEVYGWHGIDLAPQPHAMGDAAVTQHDITQGPPFQSGPGWDGVYMLDVLEHIRPEDEAAALRHVSVSLNEDGTLIVGVPSLESQPFASALSKAHHVNCKTEDGLRETLRRHFHNVFLFGMNDETLHTGFGPMCQYRLAVCAGKR